MALKDSLEVSMRSATRAGGILAVMLSKNSLNVTEMVNARDFMAHALGHMNAVLELPEVAAKVKKTAPARRKA